MPASPELDDVDGLVRRMKVERQRNAKQARQPDRHVGITREIKIELEGIGQRTAPGLQCGQRDTRRSRIKHRPRISAHRIGQHHFLEQADGENRQANGGVFIIEAVGFGTAELRHHLGVMQHRPGDQVREVGDEQAVMHEVVFAHLAEINIGEKRNLREGEKRNAQRQDDFTERQAGAAQVVETAEKKIRILEVSEQQQIGRHRSHEQRFRARLCAGSHCAADRRAE